MLSRPARVGTDRRNAFAAPLAADAKRAAGQVQVAFVQAGQFTDAQAGRIEHLEDRAVAQAQGIADGGADSSRPISSDDKK